jgi:glycosyltransferase involved in cell wall biosynthesis
MKVCLITHPCLPLKNTGQGIARYSYEILFRLKGEVNFYVIMPRKIDSYMKLVIEECYLPIKLLSSHADLYHAVSPVGGKTAIITKKSPLIVTIHDILPYFSEIYPSYISYLYHKLCNLIAIKSDAIIATSYMTKNFLVSSFKVPPEKVKVIYMGVDLKTFRPLPKTFNEAKRILFIGGTHHRLRGVDTLLKAFSIISRKLRNTELLIGGISRDENFVRRIIRALKISDKVKMLGYIPESALPKYYNLADLFVFPSRIGFSLSLFEAMACGTPVIASDTFDTAELVGDGALLVKPDDINQLANAMFNVLTDEKLRRDLINKGFQRVKKFSWERTAKETFTLYKEVMGS